MRRAPQGEKRLKFDKKAPEARAFGKKDRRKALTRPRLRLDAPCA